MAGGEKIEQRRTDVSTEISGPNDKDNESDPGPSPGFAMLLRLTLLTNTWKCQLQQPQRNPLIVKYIPDSRKS